jgi:hypothetical protein
MMDAEIKAKCTLSLKKKEKKEKKYHTILLA